MQYKQGQSFSFSTEIDEDHDFSIYDDIIIQVRKQADDEIVVQASLLEGHITVTNDGQSFSVEGPVFDDDLDPGTYKFDIRMVNGTQIDYSETENIKILPNITTV